MKRFAEDADTLSINTVEYNDKKIGFITEGNCIPVCKGSMP